MTNDPLFQAPVFTEPPKPIVSAEDRSPSPEQVEAAEEKALRRRERRRDEQRAARKADPQTHDVLDRITTAPQSERETWLAGHPAWREKIETKRAQEKNADPQTKDELKRVADLPVVACASWLAEHPVWRDAVAKLQRRRRKTDLDQIEARLAEHDRTARMMRQVPKGRVE